MDSNCEKADTKPPVHAKHSKHMFVVDYNTRLYHTKTCCELTKIEPENAKLFSGYPEYGGFLPCPKCCVERAARFIQNPLYQHMARKKYSKLPKAEIMKSQIQDLCDLCGLLVEFNGPMAYVTTLAGEWFFDIFSNPIRLHHKNWNSELKTEFQSRGVYHVQDIDISSPLMAIAYIHRHEQATVRRILATDDNQLLSGEDTGAEKY